MKSLSDRPGIINIRLASEKELEGISIDADPFRDLSSCTVLLVKLLNFSCYFVSYPRLEVITMDEEPNPLDIYAFLYEEEDARLHPDLEKALAEFLTLFLASLENEVVDQFSRLFPDL